MPTIPKSSATPTVKVAPAADIYQSFARDSRSFGGGVGQSISKVGNVVSDIQLNELALQNEAKAKEIDVEFSQALRSMQYDPQSGYYAKSGRDAYEYQPLFDQATEELYNQHIEKAENPSQQSMLEGVMRQRVERAKGGVIRHANKEYKAWMDGASMSRINDSIQESAVNYNDPDYVNVLRASGRNEIIDMGQRAGKDQEVINEELKTYDSTIHIESIENMIQQDVKVAREYFEANKDEIDGTEHNKILRSLKMAEQGDLATNLEHYSQLNQMAAFDVETFIGVDLDAYELSSKDYKKFDNDKKVAQLNRSKFNDRMSGVKRAMQLSSVTLKSAGIDTTPKEGSKKAKQLDEFQGALLQEINQFRTDNNNRAPTDTEMLGIVDSLLIQGKDEGSGWFFDKDAFLFESGSKNFVPEVPDEERDKIIDSYIRLKSRRPTDDEIDAMYLKSQVKSARGKK